MAKRRKISEETELSLPEFNEETFVKRERRNTKVIIITFLFGLIIGVISQFLWARMSEGTRWPLIFLFALFMMPFLYKLIITLADTSDYTKRNWFSLYTSYLLTWVTVMIILVNPPFYDNTPPLVEIDVLPIYQEPGGTVKIAAYIADNSGIEDVNLTIESPNGDKIYLPFKENNSVYVWEFKNENNLLGRYNFTLYVEDKNGNGRTVNGDFNYSEDAISLVYPENGSNVNHATPIRFDVKELSKYYFRVYYLTNGEEINMTRSGIFYETSPIYKGWGKGKNVTIMVKADVIRYFYDEKINNTVIDSSIYTFYTNQNDDQIGKEPSPTTEKLPSPQPKRITPGFETSLLILVLLLVIVWKRRK